LAKELREGRVSQIIEKMAGAGILDALDELPELTLGGLRRTAIPHEDMDLLRRAGVSDPDGEIAIVIAYTRSRFHNSPRSPSKVAFEAQPELNRAADVLEGLSSAKGSKSPSGDFIKDCIAFVT
jgi:hypothetical protein